jgi:sugar O-acyltransferase (sialic acid O-acetyltransferase NeuD family)
MKFYIYGAGGHSGVVYEAFTLSGNNCDGFIDDFKSGSSFGEKIYQLNMLDSVEKKIHIAIGDNDTRERIIHQIEDDNFFSITHPSASVSMTSNIHSGVFIAANSVVSTNSVIGKHSIINHSSVIDHDCIIGKYSHIAPKVALGGKCVIGNNVLIGSGAIILPELSIASNTIIGAGSIVTKSIQKAGVYRGSPAIHS